MAYKIEKQGGEFAASELWNVKGAPHQYSTPVLNAGFLYGLSADMTFFCMDARTGKEVWTDTARRGETGGILNGGSVLLALSGNAELVAFESSSKAFTEVAKYKVSATPGYSYPIVAGNRVYVKGPTTLTLWTIDE